MVRKFARQFAEPGMAFLDALQAETGWWRDLLDYRFTDVSGKEQPLFLAVRNGYLNAYVEGQSVFKIGWSERANPPGLRAGIHHKFVDKNAKEQRNVPFDGEAAAGKPYLGKETLAEWVTNAQGHVRSRSDAEQSEKQGIAVILGNNPRIIDVEMGLPLSESDRMQGKRAAPRMDIVALEAADDAIKIVFYETKLFRNPDLRANNLFPKVFGQLQCYRDWIASCRRIEEVADAYRQACRLLVRLNGMRRTTAGGTQVSALDPLICRAAKEGSNLQVDTKPRLIVFGYQEDQVDPKKQKGTYWKRHECALRDAGVALIMQPLAQEIVLP